MPGLPWVTDEAVSPKESVISITARDRRALARTVCTAPLALYRVHLSNTTMMLFATSQVITEQACGPVS